jgi:hypothetical protein
MMETGSVSRNEILASFFKRLETIEAMLRIIVSEAKIRALLTFRGDPERKVLLDFAHFPARVVLEDQAKDADLNVTITGEVMHDVLSGRMSAGQALGQRELLLRGSASHLARLIPLFDFGPVLYREYLEKLGSSLSSPQSDSKMSKERTMESRTFNGDPIPLVSLSGFEKAMFGALNGVSYALGYLVGLLRYRVFEKLNLFDVLSAMSRGLAAAAPQERLESHSSRD